MVYLLYMALNIKNERVERLAAEVARMARETKTEAIGRALEDRKARLAFKTSPQDRLRQLKDYLQREVWPNIPPAVRGKKLTKREREAILGIGHRGYPE
jgi:antitoxin VapB